MSNTNSEWVSKLQDSLTEIKISSANVESKIEQIVIAIQKLEMSIDDMKNTTASQDTRLALLEERLNSCSSIIPDNLVEDFAIIKSQITSYRKLSWMVSSVVTGLVIKMFFDLTVAL